MLASYTEEDKITYEELAPSLQLLFDVLKVQSISTANLTTNGIDNQDVKINTSNVLLETDDNFHICLMGSTSMDVYINGTKYTQSINPVDPNPVLKNRVFLYDSTNGQLYFYKDPSNIMTIAGNTQNQLLNFTDGYVMKANTTTKSFRFSPNYYTARVAVDNISLKSCKASPASDATTYKLDADVIYSLYENARYIRAGSSLVKDSTKLYDDIDNFVFIYDPIQNRLWFYSYWGKYQEIVTTTF